MDDATFNYNGELADEKPPHSGFSQPRSLLVKSKTYWHGLCERTYDENVVELEKMITKGLKALRKWKALQGVAPLDIGALAYNVDVTIATNEPFRLCEPISLTLTVQEALALSFEVENNPFAGTAHFITTTSVYLHVIPLYLRQVLEDCAGIVTLSIFIDKLNSHDISKPPNVGLTKGRSVYIPFGFVPMVVGIGSKNGELAAYDNANCMSHFVMDFHRAASAPLIVQAEVGAFIHRSMARFSKVWTENYLQAMKAYGKLVWEDAVAIKIDGKNDLFEVKLYACGTKSWRK